MKINAENLVTGRIASLVAKEALEGKKVEIINAEKAVILGNKNNIVSRYKTRIDRAAKGNPLKGPKYSRMADRLLRTAIKGMLPTNSKRGREAIGRVIVSIGVPENVKAEEFERPENAKNHEQKRFITLGELSKTLGAR